MRKYIFKAVLLFVLSGSMVNSEYVIKDGHVYYKSAGYVGGDEQVEVVPTADVRTFTILDSNYAKDSKNVFFREEKIDSADAQTFEINKKGYYYGKDRNSVYYMKNKINGVDSTSFEIVDDNYSKDKNNVYFMEEILTGADSKSFRMISGTDYARDKDNIFYEGGKVGRVNGENIEKISKYLLRNDGSLYFYFWKFDEFKNKKIEILTGNSPMRYYIKDGKYVYYLSRAMEEEVDGKIIKLKNIDYNTFGFVDKKYSHYIKDKNGIYTVSYGKANKMDVDLNTFKIIDGIFSIDKNNVFYDYIKLDKISSKGFEIIKQVWDANYYLKDKDKVYFLDAYIGYPDIKAVEGADVESFDIINDVYSKDKNHIFCNGKILSGADINTFKISEGRDMSGNETAKDGKYRYNRCEIIDKNFK